MCTYTYIWEKYNDLTGIMINKRNHPKLAEFFMFVNYSTLPRSK